MEQLDRCILPLNISWFFSKQLVLYDFWSLSYQGLILKVIKDFFGIFRIKPKKYNYWWYVCYSCKLENKCRWHDVGLNLFQWQIYYKFTMFSNCHEIRNKPMSISMIKVTFNIVNICPDNKFCWQQPKNMSDTNYSNWTNIPRFFTIVWTFWPSELKFVEKIKVL